ncbi:MAG: hypothetical protein U5K29_04495 [Acidimicrobiales bacterium]|nr:hypothetical protein [Acidimicrobiales bacterium]
MLDDHIRREPGSVFAHLVEQGQLVETEVTEKLHRELYPSQTWYSMNSGVPYEKHQVFWYGDPKPAEHPLYWQVAARAGRSVGVVNTLHSSPLAQQCADGNFAFVIPDCFAESPDTVPAKYRRFQELNLELTNESGRNASVKPRLSYLGTGASLPMLGVRPTTMGRVGAMAARVATKRMNKERLRVAQSMLLSDMFVKLCRKHDPDLAVYFTNHVASAMHRYWYALFPDDWTEARYSDEWVERYSDEIPAAMRALDNGIADVWKWCEATDRTLVVLTSMGQRAAPALDTSATGTAVVRDPVRFAEALGVASPFTVGLRHGPSDPLSVRHGRARKLPRRSGYSDRGTLGESLLDVERPRVGRYPHLSTFGDLSERMPVRLGTTSSTHHRLWRSLWEPNRATTARGHTIPQVLMLIADPLSMLDRSLPPRVDALDVAPTLLVGASASSPR